MFIYLLRKGYTTYLCRYLYLFIFFYITVIFHNIYKCNRFFSPSFQRVYLDHACLTVGVWPSASKVASSLCAAFYFLWPEGTFRRTFSLKTSSVAQSVCLLSKSVSPSFLYTFQFLSARCLGISCSIRMRLVSLLGDNVLTCP